MFFVNCNVFSMMEICCFSDMLMYVGRGWLLLLLVTCCTHLVTSLTSDEIASFTSRNVQLTTDGGMHTFESNGLPDHDTGDFPNPDNPNEISQQQHSATFYEQPQLADTPGCLNMGQIGYAVNGVALFNPYSALGTNAVEGDWTEVFDDCSGHPEPTGVYHYHQIPACLHDDIFSSQPDDVTDMILGVDRTSVV